VAVDCRQGFSLNAVFTLSQVGTATWCASSIKRWLQSAAKASNVGWSKCCSACCMATIMLASASCRTSSADKPEPITCTIGLSAAGETSPISRNFFIPMHFSTNRERNESEGTSTKALVSRPAMSIPSMVSVFPVPVSITIVAVVAGAITRWPSAAYSAASCGLRKPGVCVSRTAKLKLNRCCCQLR